ncbi:MAG TPA: efflux RND transporter periplasmic adaptor subunit [Anaerolineae bacterium]|nr:efflux RND transporter periplasmic adaptor subunit [Anaerolineae bacterium]
MKRTSKKRRALWVALAVVLIAGLGLAGCAIARRRAQAASVPNTEDVATASIGDLSASASASGQLLPQSETQLALSRPGRVKHVYVDVGDVVDAGQTLLELESGDLERARQSAEQSLQIQEANLASLTRAPDPADVAAARAAVESAQAQLDDLLAGPTDRELAQAQASLETAQARLDELVAGPSANELAQARTALDSAKAALQAAKARYDALDDQLVVAQSDIDNAVQAIGRARDAYDQLVWNSRDPMVSESWGPHSPQAAAVRRAEVNRDVAVANKTLTEINANDSSVRAAEAQVAQAEAALAQLTDERTAQIAAYEAQVAQAQANLAALTDENDVAIAAARAQLAQTQANLARLLEGPSEAQLATAQAQVEQARTALEEATDNLQAAALVAPFAGTVTALYSAEGEHASGPVVELVDTTSLRVVLNVDEVDIGAIRVGQSSAISLETWPERDLRAEVVSIAPKAQNGSGTVTYEVRLSFDPEDLPVLTGMTANADLTTAQREGVLLVPNRAITADREAGRYYVNKIVDGEIVKTEVTIGLRDDALTEITSGLSAGDQVFTGTIEAGLDFRSGPPAGARELGSQ